MYSAVSVSMTAAVKLRAQ